MEFTISSPESFWAGVAVTIAVAVWLYVILRGLMLLVDNIATGRAVRMFEDWKEEEKDRRKKE